MSASQQQKVETQLSAGERLRAAREQRKLTVAEVAAQLRLLKANIQNLEDGLWENLHGRAYARGYFFSYVRFLGLSEDEMLVAFNYEYKNSADEALLEIKTADTVKQNSRWLKLSLITMIIAGLIGAAYSQWSSEISLAVGTENSQLLASSIEVDDKSFDESIIEPLTVTESYSIVDAVQLPPSEEELILNTATRLSNVVSSQLDELHTVAEVENKHQLIDMPVAMPSFEAILHFSADCWLKVVDADGKQLWQKVVRANSSITLAGKPPYTVSLGQSEAVSITVNGNNFDISPYVRNNVAHFTLGEQS